MERTCWRVVMPLHQRHQLEEDEPSVAVEGGLELQTAASGYSVGSCQSTQST
jgi:hypothetical protein